jgi:FkbM family methyltransferase
MTNRLVERWGAVLGEELLDCELFTGAKMSCDLTHYIERQIYYFGAFEIVEAFLFKTMLTKGMVVIDAGANVGQYSLIAAAMIGNEGEVHAFEPEAANFARFVRHVHHNRFDRLVRANMTALWHSPGRLVLSLRPELAGNAGAYSVVEDQSIGETQSCQAVRLDDYVQERGLRRVDVVKMDIEGSELMALEGAAEVIATWRPTIFMELNRLACRNLGYAPERLLDHLKGFGYRAWLISNTPERSGPITRLDSLNLENVIFHTRPLPKIVTEGWSLRSILSPLRRRRGLS